jgi:hypothetical protein
VLAFFDTSGVSNGGTEAINLIIEKVRGLAHGFRDFEHSGCGSCWPPTDNGPTEPDLPMLNSEDPVLACRAIGIVTYCTLAYNTQCVMWAHGR